MPLESKQILDAALLKLEWKKLRMNDDVVEKFGYAAVLI